MSSLQQMLDRIESSGGEVSIPGLAREMGLSRGRVESMLDFWVRKGRLRAVDGSACQACRVRGDCQRLAGQQKIYELIREREPGLEPPECWI